MKHNIDALLDKYWEGETSVAEENIIKEYYKSGNVHPDHLPFADLFGYFEKSGHVTMPATISLEKPAGKMTSIRSWMIAAAAASVLLIASIFVIKNNEALPQENMAISTLAKGEIEDPEEALRVTKEALAMVSKNFNKSKNKLKEQMAVLDKATVFK